MYIPFPFLGGLIAILFHEKVYKRIVKTINESENEEDTGNYDDILGDKTGIEGN